MPAGDAIAVNPTTGDLSYDSDLVTAGGTVSAATLANVTGSSSSVTVFAANSAARGRMIANDSTAILYLKFGSGAASTTSYTVALAGTGGGVAQYYEFPAPLYTGAVTGIWASAVGAARTTEV